LLTGYRDGICAKASGVPNCPGGTLPVPSYGPNACARTCTGTVNDECGSSLTCGSLGGGNFACIPLVCRANSDCTAGFTCDPASGRCLAAPSVGSAIGTACTTSATCAGKFCIAQRAMVPLFSGGYCSATCTLLPDLSDTCPSGAVCLGDGTPAIGEVGLCYDLCDAPAGGVSRFGGCRTGESYVCRPFTTDPRFGFCDSN
jgi:hypothetical protein